MSVHALQAPPPADGPAAPLRPVQYAVLGLLRGSRAHGYELQRFFAEDGVLGGVLRVEQAALYSALKDLAARGLIAGRETREGARPPRTEYGLTAAGRATLEEWLRAPVHRLRQVRLDFLLKVYFARAEGRDAERALVDAQIAACHRYLASLEGRAAEQDPAGFAYLVTQSRVSAARATLEWLREYRRQR